MRTIIADKQIYLGRAGEINNVKIKFKLDEEWQELATAQNTYLALEQADEEMGVPLNVAINGEYAECVLTCSSLKTGQGRAQLTILEEGEDITKYPLVKVLKTKTYETFVDGSINTGGCACSSWMDELLALSKAWRSGEIGTLNLEFVTALPSLPNVNTIYALLTGGEYVMWMYHNNVWVSLGVEGKGAPVYIVTALPADPKEGAWYIKRTINEGSSTYQLNYFSTNTGYIVIADIAAEKAYADQKVLVEKTRAQGVEQGLYDDITEINDLIPSAASSSNQLADKAYVESSVDVEEQRAQGIEATKVDKVEGKGLSTNDYSNTDKSKVDGMDTSISTAVSNHNVSSSAHSDIRTSISTIEGKIMSGTTTTNQLTNKDFVNSSIETSTATFQGNYDVVSDLGLTDSATNEQVAAALLTHVSQPTNNDYCFVVFRETQANSQNIINKRFKFNGTSWLFEYKINNTGFTAAQFAAIDSGADTTKINQIATNTSAIAGKQAQLTNEQLEAVDSGVTDDKVTGYDSHLSSTANPHSTSFSNLQGNATDNTSLNTALNGKVSKITGSAKVYTTDDTAVDYTSNAIASTVASRDANANLSVATPTANSHAVTKQYADNLVSNTQALTFSLEDDTSFNGTFILENE